MRGLPGAYAPASIALRAFGTRKPPLKIIKINTKESKYVGFEVLTALVISQKMVLLKIIILTPQYCACCGTSSAKVYIHLK
jgi:hypothetical protein